MTFGRRDNVPMSAARPMSTSLTANLTSFEHRRISAQVEISRASPNENPCMTHITARRGAYQLGSLGKMIIEVEGNARCGIRFSHFSTLLIQS